MITDHGTGDPGEITRLHGVNFEHAIKVNLRYEEGSNGVGIWAVPCTREELHLANDDASIHEPFFVYLLNDPICPNLKWGSKIECLTNGAHRPYSKEIASEIDAQHAYTAALDAIVYGQD